MARSWWSVAGPAHRAPVVQGDSGNAVSDDMLLEICRGPGQDGEPAPEWLADLRTVPQAIQSLPRHARSLELSLTLLTSVLGKMPEHNPTHLPFGYSGAPVQSPGWVEEETVERIGKQIAGLVWHERDPDSVAVTVECAIVEAIRLGFVEQQSYDAWRPGIPSGRGWRAAVRATPYGVSRARALTSSAAPAPEAPVAVEADERLDGVAATETNGRADNERAMAGVVPEADRVDATAEPYAWARQIDVLNAANQVLGAGMLNKGVLSRACQLKRVQTNGRPGRASRVSVASFLAWVGRHFSVAPDEQVQIRNAIIGEITARGG